MSGVAGSGERPRSGERRRPRGTPRRASRISASPTNAGLPEVHLAPLHPRPARRLPPPVRLARACPRVRLPAVRSPRARWRVSPLLILLPPTRLMPAPPHSLLPLPTPAARSLVVRRRTGERSQCRPRTRAEVARLPPVRRRTSSRRGYPIRVAIGLRTNPPARLIPASQPPLRPLPPPAARSPAVRRRTGERSQCRSPAASRSGVAPPVRRRTSKPRPLRAPGSEQKRHGSTGSAQNQQAPRAGNVSAPTGTEPHQEVRARLPGDGRQRRRRHPNPHARAARGGTPRRQWDPRCASYRSAPAPLRGRSRSRRTSSGNTERSVILRHAVKNAIIPVVTLVGMQLPILVGGSVIIENIFNLPGLGRLMLGCAQRPRLPGGVGDKPVLRHSGGGGQPGDRSAVRVAGPADSLRLSGADG